MMNPCRSIPTWKWISILFIYFRVQVFAATIQFHDNDDDSLELPGAGMYCTQPLVRREWRTLSMPQKEDYIRAVKCTQSLANLTSYEGVRSRFDDFQAVHINTADEIHYVGHFLPWHRGFVSIYETTLRNECGYEGGIPYWDWELDINDEDSILKSPIFDPTTGFGGDGVPGTYTLPYVLPDSSAIHPETFVGCVQDGPFASHLYTVHLGPGRLITDHCLVRGIADEFKYYLSSEFVQRALEQPTYDQFRVELEGKGNNPAEHGSGHLVIGGELGNLYSSPADPIFFLHHANLDRIWWTWQMRDLETRLTDMSTFSDHHRKGEVVKHTVALDYELRYNVLTTSLPIRNVMDIKKFPLCYTYE